MKQQTQFSERERQVIELLVQSRSNKVKQQSRWLCTEPSNGFVNIGRAKMDDMNWTLPPELESALEDFYAAPQPDSDFASGLDLELRHRFDEIPLPLKVERMSFMQTLRARPLIAILVAILALLLLSSVAYAIGRLSGFIPGFGFTSDAGAVTMLKETVSAESNGITVSVEKAVSDGSRFWVEVNVHGLPEGQELPADKYYA